MRTTLAKQLVLGASMTCGAASAQVTFYENDAFGFRSSTTQGKVENCRDQGFNDRASSVVITRGRWEM